MITGKELPTVKCLFEQLQVLQWLTKILHIVELCMTDYTPVLVMQYAWDTN